MPSSTLIKTVTLASGRQLPVLGLGVSRSGAETYDAVRTALKLGYRLIDCAIKYGNEDEVGRAIRDSGIPRDEILVTSKFCALASYEPGTLAALVPWSYEETVAKVKQSLQTFGLDYLDLFLLHAPGSPEHREDAWRALEDLRSEGLIHEIGVSNFSEQHLEKLAKTWRVPPAVNQFEVHPFYSRPELVEYCQKQGIVVEAYAPLTQGRRLNDPTIVQVAEEVKATPAQVMLAWEIAKGVVPIAKSVHENRLIENLEATKVQLSPDHIALLDTLDEHLNCALWDPIYQHAV